MQLVYAQPIPEPEPVCKEGTILTNGACVSVDGSICGPGTTYQDGICVVDKIENSTKSSSGKWGGYQFTHLEIENIDGMLYYVSEPFALNSSVEKIIFHDVEFSPPYRYDPPRYVYSDVTFSDGTEETLRVLFDYPTFTEHVKPQAGFTETFDGIRFLVRVDLKELSPLKQIKSGITIDEIQCKDGLVQVIKNSDNSPGCVTLQTKQKLIERGWAEPLGDVVFGRSVSPESVTNFHPCQQLAFDAFANTTLKQTPIPNSTLSIGYGDGENEDHLRGVGCFENRHEWQTQEFLDYLNGLIENEN
jgi:hypothetical protein